MPDDADVKLGVTPMCAHLMQQMQLMQQKQNKPPSPQKPNKPPTGH